MIMVAAVLGGLGMVSVLSKRTFLGILVGIQLLLLSAAMVFILAGFSSKMSLEGHLFGIFISLGAVAQLVAGFALAIRLYYLRKKVDMSGLNALKH